MRLKEALFKAIKYNRCSLLQRGKWGKAYMLSLKRDFAGEQVPYKTHLFMVIPNQASVSIPWTATTEDIVADDWIVIE